MAYSIHNHQQNRIPVPVALVLLFLMMVGLSFFFQNNQKVAKRAERIAITMSEIANIRDNTATIFWRTDQPTSSYVVYGADTKELVTTAFDELDKADEPTPRHNHLITLKELQPNTQYFYQIVNDEEKMGQTADTPFTFQTTRKVTSSLDIPPLYGEAAHSNREVVNEAVVIIKMSDIFPLITLTKADGSFLVSPCCIFNSTTLEPFYPSAEQDVMIEVVAENGQTSKVTTTLGAASPLNEIVIIDQTEKKIAEKKATAQTLGAQSAVLLEAEQVSNYDNIDIIFPKDNASIPGSRPLLKGLGEPGKRVSGRLEPDGKLFEVQVNDDRVWDFAVPFDLSPGKRSLSIETEDIAGKKLALNRVFTILKSGQAVLGEATPSGTLSPTIAPTAGPTITSLPTPTIIPVTTTPPPPISGINILPFTLFSVALVIFGAGVILLF